MSINHQRFNLMGTVAALFLGGASALHSNIVGAQKRGSRVRGKRRNIKYRHDQHKFTKIRPEVSKAWHDLPDVQQETRQLGRQSQRKGFKAYRASKKAQAMREGLKGGSAAMVLD